MRVPRPPSEPGKGSYWKLDPNHQPNAEGGHGGATVGTGGGATRTSKSSRRASATRSVGRRSTSDPQSPPTPTGQPGTHGIPDIPLAPVPILSKRNGNEADSYIFKMGTHPASTIMAASSTVQSSASRRHSHLLSHDHDYTQQQPMPFQQQHPDHQSGQYAHMPSSFSLASLNTQQPHHGAFFSPTSATGPGSGSDFGSSTSFYSNGAPPNLNDTNMMDSSSDSSSFSRFPNQGLYLQGAGGNSAGISSISRPLSVGSHGAQGQFASPYGGVGGSGTGSSGASGHGGAYGANTSHSYGGMSQQSGGAGAPLHASSTSYGMPFNRGGSGASGGPASYGPSSAYRASVEYSTGPSGYNSTSPPTSNSFAMSQGLVSGASGMMSPLSPGTNASGSIPVSSTGPASGSARLPSSSNTVPQESRNPGATGGGGGGGNAW